MFVAGKNYLMLVNNWKTGSRCVLKCLVYIQNTFTVQL